jgi:hypothetical protein
MSKNDSHEHLKIKGSSLETAQIVLLTVLLNRIQEDRARASMQVTMNYHTSPATLWKPVATRPKLAKQIRGQIDINGLETCTMKVGKRKPKMYVPG